MEILVGSNFVAVVVAGAGRLIVLQVAVFSSSLEPIFCLSTQLFRSQAICGDGRRIDSGNLYRMVVVIVMFVLKEPMVLAMSKISILDIDDVAVSGITAPADPVEIPKGFKRKTFSSPHVDSRLDDTVVFFGTRKK